jgi:hypothetical protein
MAKKYNHLKSLKNEEDQKMKHAFILLVAVLISVHMFGQTPEMMSYQALIRDAENNLVTNSPVGMQLSILQGAANGIPVYVEFQNPVTNANGLVTVIIGNGNVLQGSLASIDWSADSYYIQTEVDPLGGNSFTITITNQLLTVPYAFHAKSAESITGELNETDPDFNAWDKSTGISINENQIADLGNYITTESDPVFSAWDKSTGITINESQINDLGSYLETETDPVYNASTAAGITEMDTAKWNGKQDKLVAGSGISIDNNTINVVEESPHYVGELYGGGIVFWVDHSGEHGLVLSLVDVSTGKAWSNITSAAVNTTNDWDGESNTTAIVGQPGHSESAAQLCNEYINEDYGTGVYDDWYLPGIAELNAMWGNFYDIQKVLSTDGNDQTTTLMRQIYWSSSEYTLNKAWSFSMAGGYNNYATKTGNYYVRAVRAF